MPTPTERRTSDQPPEATVATPKSIVLFSDGTGNSSARLFKTNVWRMYEAVDLGPPAAGKRPQISYYDDGVGTSSFKPLAALGGAFGWGLKRNVLDIYRYVCRNYQDGDEIYAFGFSRGAFTARLAVALIASEGLVRSESEADLEHKTVAAYRRFRQGFLPRRLERPTRVARKLRDAVLNTIDRLRGRERYDPTQNAHPDISFIGVWDTVAAYGGPITEITRAIDNWFFPLSMPDYRLHERVQCARHALAIDDERDAFHPLLWDEVHEERLQDRELVAKDRLQQVWFTGMHADVGGGYPDESLSYISLLWMMEEAERAGLRTLTVIKDRILALASSFGPIHNSRAGMGSYYRYQPRKIEAWVDPADSRTLSLRDPAIRDERRRSRGLLRSVHVHESVINRIATGTDRYAPITLPDRFDIIPAEQGETAPQADSNTSAPPPRSAAPRPLLDPPLRVRLKEQEAGAARAAAMESVWNLVWWRRITYFATLAVTLFLLGLPLLLSALPPAPILDDGRTWIGGVIRLSTIVLPGVAARWVEIYADNPFYFLLLGSVIVLLLGVGSWMERTLRDRARRIWHQTLAGDVPESRPSRIQAFRTSPGYQRFLQIFKWYFLPDWVLAPLTVVVLGWLLFAAYVQITLPYLEYAVLCQSSSGEAASIRRIARDFSPVSVCSQSFGLVASGERYVVTFDVDEPWFDASLPATPEGIPASEFRAGLGYLAAPFKRVIEARYLQPLIEIRPTDKAGRFIGNLQIYPLAVRQVGDSPTRFRADFKAPRGGELFVFVNDAVLPFTGAGWRGLNYEYFYRWSGTGDQRGNRGSACVTIESANLPPGAAAQPPDGNCTNTGPGGADGRRSAAASR